MKKAPLLALFFLSACHPLQWQSFAVDAQVTVEFPGQPQQLSTQIFNQLKHPEFVKSWACNTTSGSTYHVTRAARPGMHLATDDTLARAAYYDRKIEALKRQGAKLLWSRPFTIAKVRGREMAYRSYATGRPVLAYSHSVILDSVEYTLMFIPSAQRGLRGALLALTEAGQRRRFFKSIVVTPSSILE